MLPPGFVAAASACFLALLMVKEVYERHRFHGRLDAIPPCPGARLCVWGFYLLFVEMSVVVALYLLGATDALGGSIRFPLDGAVQLAGVAIVSAGLGLAFLSIRQIDGKKMAVSGPYRAVRHPIYLGCDLVALGLFLLFLNPLTLLPLLMIVPGQVKAAEAEERILLQRFGKEYADYMERTPAYLPRWRR